MILILCLFILFFGGCEQKPHERQYNEIIIEAPHLSWLIPQGWKEQTGGTMRLATFHPMVNPDSIDCYITFLAGPAGGLEANLARWFGQLGLAPSDDNLEKLSNRAQSLMTKDGLEIRVFDFTTLQNNLLDKSMLAAVINLDQTTVFVKMTGSIKSLKENKDNFLKLLQSIVYK